MSVLDKSPHPTAKEYAAKDKPGRQDNQKLRMYPQAAGEMLLLRDPKAVVTDMSVSAKLRKIHSRTIRNLLGAWKNDQSMSVSELKCD